MHRNAYGARFAEQLPGRSYRKRTPSQLDRLRFDDFRYVGATVHHEPTARGLGDRSNRPGYLQTAPSGCPSRSEVDRDGRLPGLQQFSDAPYGIDPVDLRVGTDHVEPGKIETG
jgi:hypothetical protein